jgi:GAF domain-containing protein
MPPEPPDCTNPSAESTRLAALHRYEILDTPVEAEFDDFTKLAAHVCSAPIAVVNLIDKDRQWFKSEIGLGVRETPLDISICRHAILQRGLFVVPDTTLDERFRHNPMVTGSPHLRFYAGALLESSEGLPLGTLCVLDYQPRHLTEPEGHALRLLARQVMEKLELRLTARELAARNAELEAARREIRTLEGLLPICAKCKKIRDEAQDWVPVETYLHEHSDVNFTHSLCPVCAQFYLGQADTRHPAV